MHCPGAILGDWIKKVQNGTISRAKVVHTKKKNVTFVPIHHQTATDRKKKHVTAQNVTTSFDGALFGSDPTNCTKSLKRHKMRRLILQVSARRYVFTSSNFF
jgi:hypothetical protein